MDEFKIYLFRDDDFKIALQTKIKHVTENNSKYKFLLKAARLIHALL